MNKGSIISCALVLGSLFATQDYAYSKTYLTENQAKLAIYKTTKMKKVPVKLTKEQMKSIQKSSKTRVRSNKINVFKTKNGDWFILDNVIGKHENIDIAVGIGKDGNVNGVEVLRYRETYGFEVMNPKWLAQFDGINFKKHLKLDREIKNISGATLSCRNITDGINRLTHTWNQVLRHL